MDIRRKCKRYACDFEVGILNDNNDYFRSETCDISVDGIYLLVPIRSIAGLEDSGLILDVGQQIKLSIPNPAKTAQCEVTGIILHRKVIIDGRHFIGVQFDVIENRERDFINDVIEDLKTKEQD
jgi:hypothetical protein